MIFPEGITGPKFEQGDLVAFVFDGAELVFRLPKIPINRSSYDEVSKIRDFRNINTDSWETNDQDRPLEQLVLQRWCFEHEQSLDDIALAELFISVLEVPSDQRKKNMIFSEADFQKTILSWHDYSVGKHHNEKNEQDPSWPALINNYHCNVITKEYANWLSVWVALTPEAKPISILMAPINSRFMLMMYIEIQSLHYAGRTNPYSDTLLKQFEFDLFEDFISHMDLRYTPETIAIIESLKK